jgi:hypothetical protein
VLLRDHFDALEADFRRYYQLDLAGACWGTDEIGGRELVGMIRNLPSDSATARALHRDREAFPAVQMPAALSVVPARPKASPSQIQAFFASGNN